MAPAPPDLHVVFFPLMAPGHIIPITDMATLFAGRGVRCTILTTPTTAALVRRTVNRAAALGLPVGLHLLEIPSGDAGFPDGLDSLTMVTSPEMSCKFFSALHILREPFGHFLRERRPDAVVTDMYLPWTAEVAAGVGVPRLVFHGMGFFPLCVLDALDRHVADVGRAIDAAGRVVVPDLPHRVELRRSQLHDSVLTRNEFGEFMSQIRASELESYGAVVNSFYELEAEYADHYMTAMKRRAWHVGPVSLCNGDAAERGEAGASAAETSRQWFMAWLDSQEHGSVIYVCFGSLCQLTTVQLRQIAVGLESSGHPFIWVVRDGAGGGGRWLPEGFEDKVTGESRRGVLICGWAPQVLLLGHPAVGGFMTHCGWNSVMEAISAGVPMVTWPLFAEQFYNERLVVDVLGVGVPAGAEEWGMREEQKAVVGGDRMAAAVACVMGGGDEAVQMRRRAAELKERARRAVEPSGSSDADLSRLIDELATSKAVATIRG